MSINSISISGRNRSRLTASRLPKPIEGFTVMLQTGYAAILLTPVQAHDLGVALMRLAPAVPEPSDTAKAALAVAAAAARNE